MGVKGRKSKDSLGDRMKDYERAGTYQHMKLCPLVARMDGRGFHNFTKGLKRPYDERLSKLMVETTRALVMQTNAAIGYTQSDEITLVFHAESYESELFFDGKHDKVVSILASTTTSVFNKLLPHYIPEKVWDVVHDYGAGCHGGGLGSCTCGALAGTAIKPSPMFDARVFSVPTLGEAANALVWREQDATRNSVQMAAHAVFSHKECHCKNRSALMDMLMEKGINWNDYPAFFKRGSYLKRRTTRRFLTGEELALFRREQSPDPETHEVVRTVVEEVDMPPYNKIQDRVATYFSAR